MADKSINGVIVKNSAPFADGSTGAPGAGKTVKIKLLGTPEAGDKYNLTLGEGNFGYLSKPTAPISFLLTLGKKLYAINDTLLQFSAIDAPTNWDYTYDLGAGFINMFNEFTGGEKLRALATYSDRLAIFARRTIQLWLMDVDPARNSQMQVLGNIGVLAPRSVAQIGDVDVFFLSDSGIRSLRSRDINNIAFSADVGNPIDELVVAAIRARGDDAADAVGVIEPTDGRYWLFMGEQVFVFSTFGGSKVSAWSTYEPGFEVETALSREGRLWLRSKDGRLYLYGGDDGITYDDCAVTGELPFLSTGTPATMKQFTAFDAVVENEWTFSLGTNPEAEDARDVIGKLWAPSFDMRRINIEAEGTHFALKFDCKEPGYARLSNVIIHYDSNEAG